MTEYELFDLMNGLGSNIIQGQAVFLTVLTAYLVVAYTVGANLTRYQVSFINFTFIIFAIVGIQAQLYNMDQIYAWGADIRKLQGVTSSPGEQASRWLFISIRILMNLGALIFMWQVRRSKAE